MLFRTRRTGLPAKPDWYPREGAADAEGGWAETAAPIFTMPRSAPPGRRARSPPGRRELLSRHRPDLPARRPPHEPPRLPAGPCRAGGWPGPAAAANSSGTGSRTGRHRSSWRSSASRRPVTRIGPKPPSTARPSGTRADHDPVAAGVARRSLTWRQRNRPDLSFYGSDQRFCVWL
jgi:hypothetical protein